MARLPAAALALAVVVGLLTVGSTAIASDNPNRIHYKVTMAIKPTPISPTDRGRKKQPDGCMDKRTGQWPAGGSVFWGYADHEILAFDGTKLHLLYMGFDSVTARLWFATPGRPEDFSTEPLVHAGIDFLEGSVAPDPYKFKLLGLVRDGVDIFPNQGAKKNRDSIARIEITADPEFTKVDTCAPGGQHP